MDIQPATRIFVQQVICVFMRKCAIRGIRYFFMCALKLNLHELLLYNFSRAFQRIPTLICLYKITI